MCHNAEQMPTTNILPIPIPPLPIPFSIATPDDPPTLPPLPEHASPLETLRYCTFTPYQPYIYFFSWPTKATHNWLKN